MRLIFLGQHMMTGSCYYLGCGKEVLVDCGMEQGPNIYENKPIPVPASQLDFVLIAHAHIDHRKSAAAVCARPRPIYGSAVMALSGIAVTAHTFRHCRGREWRNRKNRRAGKEDYVTRYTMEDALGVIRLLERHSVSSACNTIGRHSDPFHRCRSSAQFRIH